MKKTKNKPRAVLAAPPHFPWDINNELRKQHCNGCGVKGLGGWLAPGTLYGLSLTLACDIHNWDCQFGDNREQADTRFLANMMRILEVEGGWFLRLLRKTRALSYYMVVSDPRRDAPTSTID